MVLKRAAYLGAGILLSGLCGRVCAEGISLGISIPYTPQSLYGRPQPAPMLISPPLLYVAPMPPPSYICPAPGFGQSPVSATTTVTGPVYLAPRSMLPPSAQPTLPAATASALIPAPSSSPSR